MLLHTRTVADARGETNRPDSATGRESVIDPCDNCTARLLTICAGLRGHDLRRLAAIVSATVVGSGDCIFAQGDPADHVFNVTSGCVMTYRLLADGRRQVTGFLFAGDFLGLGDASCHRDSAQAVTRATVCRFSRRSFTDALATIPGLERRLLSRAGTDLGAAHDHVVLLGCRSAAERVAGFLIMLSDRACGRGRQASPVDLPMRREDIGDYLGLTLETISRVLSGFRQRGLIAPLARGRIELRNIAELRRMAGSDGVADY